MIASLYDVVVVMVVEILTRNLEIQTQQGNLRIAEALPGFRWIVCDIT